MQKYSILYGDNLHVAKDWPSYSFIFDVKKILALAALLYLVIAPFTYHPDTKLTLLYASLNGGRVWDIYSFLEKNKLNVPDFHYPPLNFWLLKAEWPLVRLVGGSGIEGWLRMGSNEAVTSPNIYTFNLASKLPLLLMLLASGWVLYMVVVKRGGTKERAGTVAMLWLFNPITIYSGVMMGQNDVLAILPFLIGLFWYYDYPLLAFLFFGIGSSVKTFPLIWSLILALSYPSKSWVKRLGLAMIPVLIYGATLLPFIGSSYFRQSVLNSGLATRMFASGIDIGFNDRILVVPLLLSVVLVLSIMRLSTSRISGVAKILLATNLVILGFSHFHPQWFIWLIPFWSIWLVTTSSRREVGDRLFVSALVLGAFVTVVALFDDKFLYWGIFASSNPGLLNLPFIGEFLAARGIGSELINNLAHSVVAGVTLVFLGSIVGKQVRTSGVTFKPIALGKVGAVLFAWLAMSLLVLVPKLFPSVKFFENGNASAQFRRMDGNHLYKQSWMAKSNNLSRLEILMKNPGLKSKDNFQIIVRDGRANQIAVREGNAVNMGDPGYFRVDWPVVADALGKNFSVEIVPEKIDGLLEIGFNSGDEMVFREYYEDRRGAWQAVGETFKVETDLVFRQPIVGLLPLVCVALL